MRDEDDDFFAELESTGTMPDGKTIEELENNPMVFVNKRKRKDRVTPEEQAEADSHGKYLPPTLDHGAILSDTTDGLIRRIVYADGFVRTKVAGIWC